jgi:AmmeMemoRadiSam system protein B
MKYRNPAVAGMFYPDNEAQLNASLDQLFDRLELPDTLPKALIVPHAGYVFSGRVAAHAYQYLKQHSDKIKRVVLLGPSHRCYLQGCAVPSYDCFVTPLGIIPVDSQSCARLRQLGLAEQYDQAHSQEHSLEVQLPFLQRCLGDFELVPITVGQSLPDSVAKVLSLLADLPGTMIIISTDLSHFLSYDQATLLDGKTIERIERRDDTIKPEDACGCHALNGMLHFSKLRGWQPQLVNKANSGDINHSKKEVVGYASFILN